MRLIPNRGAAGQHGKQSYGEAHFRFSNPSQKFERDNCQLIARDRGGNSIPLEDES
ncbi:hypothetical protein [Sphingomonas sp.]|uniref:hypothetical protein n=1 Tax=Sphingomonas sp. TaxID=28214 RepID=UPI0025F4CEE1|nr:hypothetical protein [Sphingomonas sp.]